MARAALLLISTAAPEAFQAGHAGSIPVARSRRSAAFCECLQAAQAAAWASHGPDHEPFLALSASPPSACGRHQPKFYERTEGRASLHTRAELVSRIVDRVRTEGHPYQVPGISARPITDGNPEYLQWIADETSFHQVRTDK
jgi:hypothetical protein